MKPGHAWPLLALLCAAVSATPPAHAALPPAYGGIAVLPAQGVLRLPDPTTRRTPLDAALSHAVYDSLYDTTRAARPRPLLVEGLPVRGDDGAFRVHLHPRMRVHGGGALRPRDVVASLERARGSASGWLLAGIRAVRTVPDEPWAVDIESRLGPFGLARVLATAPLAIATQRQVLRGTGPFVAAVRSNGHLHLRGVRVAHRGAPYLRELRVVPPRSARDEARAFQLGELHVSFQGGSVYGEARRPAPRAEAGTRSPVLLIPNRARGLLANAGARAAVEGAVDRERLARVGLDGTSTLGVDLHAWSHDGSHHAHGSGLLRFVVRAGDVFELRLADALAAQLDERGFRVEVRPLGVRAYRAALRTGGWELRLHTLLPILPGRVGLTAAAFAATGQRSRAEALAARGLQLRRAQAASANVAAWILGRRAQRVHHRRTLLGVSFDALGRLRLDALHRPREVLRGGDT